MREMPTHVAIDEDDIEDQAKRFNMDIDELNCLYATQLAAQINVPILICGSYTQDAQRNSTLTASIRTVETGDEFVLPPVTVDRNGRRVAAQHVYEQFQRYNTLIRSAAICQDYAASQQWESALRNCEESLAINPNAMTTRVLRANILFQLERLPESLEDFDRVLEMDPLNEDALQTAIRRARWSSSSPDSTSTRTAPTCSTCTARSRSWAPSTPRRSTGPTIPTPRVWLPKLQSSTARVFRRISA
jgi:tetratricopeptide (TPR) repeat protein